MISQYQFQEARFTLLVVMSYVATRVFVNQSYLATLDRYHHFHGHSGMCS
jgi:hypothetical protein